MTSACLRPHRHLPRWNQPADSESPLQIARGAVSKGQGSPETLKTSKQRVEVDLKGKIPEDPKNTSRHRSSTINNGPELNFFVSRHYSKERKTKTKELNRITRNKYPSPSKVPRNKKPKNEKKNIQIIHFGTLGAAGTSDLLLFVNDFRFSFSLVRVRVVSSARSMDSGPGECLIKCPIK